MTRRVTRIRALRKERGLKLHDLATRIGSTPQTIQRLETGGMTVSLEWLHRIAEALGVPPSKLVVDPSTLDATAEDEFLDMLRAELVRARRAVPLPQDTPLALMEASGKLAETLLEWQAGLRPWRDVTRVAAAVAAAATRIALDGAAAQDAGVAAPPAPPKLVINQS